VKHSLSLSLAIQAIVCLTPHAVRAADYTLGAPEIYASGGNEGCIGTTFEVTLTGNAKINLDTFEIYVGHPNPGNSPPLSDGVTFDSSWLDFGMVVHLDEDLDADGWTDTAGDCDESDDTVYPGATELCDGQDNDCDTVVPADEVDNDGDGYYECPWSCAAPTAGDCDDTDSAVKPGATEVCDGIDNDCNCIADGTNGSDGDGDGWGDGLSGGCASEDCDDSDSSIFPWEDPAAQDGYESWLGTFVDEDCDGLNCEADWYVGPSSDVYFALCRGGASVGSVGLNRTQAKAACEDSPAGYGGLAAQTGDPEGGFINTLFSRASFGIPSWWLAGIDAASEGTWTWDDGYSRTMTYTDWETNYPLATGSDWDYMYEEAPPNSDWFDGVASANRHFVCALR